MALRIAHPAGGAGGVGQQQRVEQCRVGVGDARFPRAGDAAAIAAIDREQALPIVAVGPSVVAGGERVHDVGIRRRDGQRGAAHVRFAQHDFGVGSIGGAREAIDRGLLVRSARREQHVLGSIRPQREIETAAADVDLEQPRPGGAAVGRSPHAGARGRVDAARIVDAELEIVDPVEVRRGRRRQLLPGAAAIGGDEDAAAAQRQAGAANLLAEIAFAGAGVHHVGPRGSISSALIGDVGEPVAGRPPRGAVVVALPDAAGDAGRKQRGRARSDGNARRACGRRCCRGRAASTHRACRRRCCDSFIGTISDARHPHARRRLRGGKGAIDARRKTGQRRDLARRRLVELRHVQPRIRRPPALEVVPGRGAGLVEARPARLLGRTAGPSVSTSARPRGRRQEPDEAAERMGGEFFHNLGCENEHSKPLIVSPV